MSSRRVGRKGTPFQLYHSSSPLGTIYPSRTKCLSPRNNCPLSESTHVHQQQFCFPSKHKVNTKRRVIGYFLTSRNFKSLFNTSHFRALRRYQNGESWNQTFQVLSPWNAWKSFSILIPISKVFSQKFLYMKIVSLFL